MINNANIGGSIIFMNVPSILQIDMNQKKEGEPSRRWEMTSEWLGPRYLNSSSCTPF